MNMVLLQAAAETPLLPLGIGGVIAGGVITAWRIERKESQERYAKLAEDFRTIVQDNTKAITLLTGKMDGEQQSAKVVELLVEMLKRGGRVNLEP